MKAPHTKTINALEIPGMGQVTQKTMIANFHEKSWLTSARGGKISSAFKRLVSELNLNSCPNDYETLRDQARVASGLVNYFLVVMGQRLDAIRRGRLFEQGGYETFSDFIADELTISSRSVYNFMDIYTYFGESIGQQPKDVNYSKLLPLLPLLKAKGESIPKEQIRDQFIKSVGRSSQKVITEQALDLKRKYGLAEPASVASDPLAAAVSKFTGQLPKRPNAKQKRILKALVQRIEQLL